MNNGKKGYKENQEDSEEREHLGFHIYLHDGHPGIYYGHITEDGSFECTPISLHTHIDPYILTKGKEKIPYVHYTIQGMSSHCPISEFAVRLKSFGIPMYTRETRELTNYLLSVSRIEELYEEPGYIFSENKNETYRRRKKIEETIRQALAGEENEEVETVLNGDEFVIKEIRVITPRSTPHKYEDPDWEEKNLDETLDSLYTLYNLTEDKKAFLIAFSYSLFAPFASEVRKRRLFFPNLMFLGLPETGKNSLLNFFLAKAWDMETNIKVTGDFKSEYASMFNLSGSGIPIVINDLDQNGYDRLKPYLLEGAMNPKGGSRGRPTLDVKDYETSRGIAISSNYLQVGAIENTSRFFVHVLSFGDEMRNEEWNATAERLLGPCRFKKL